MEQVKAALDHFIQAFEKLQLDEMIRSFASEASSFFPIEHHQTRLMGREQIRLEFQKVIEKAKKAGLSSLSLKVEDLDIRLYGEVALATFQIRDNMLSRRTLVLKRAGDEWLIEHLHASNAPLVTEE